MTQPQIEANARAIVTDILGDLRGRRGLRQTWESIDEDIRDEIEIAWRLIVMARLRTIEGNQP